MDGFINIREPTFTAGQRYNWMKDGFGIKGVPIRDYFLKGDDDIWVKLDTDNSAYFVIDKGEARELVERYNSIFHGKTKGVFCVVPLNAFRRVKRQDG